MKYEDYYVFLNMIGEVFILIRAEFKPGYHLILSDILHNVPAKIAHGFNPDEIYKEMRTKAEKHGVSEYLEKLIERSEAKYQRRKAEGYFLDD